MTPERLSLAEVVRWVITTLVAMAQRKAWGQIIITVQAGQIEMAAEHRSYRDRSQLPGSAGLDPVATDAADQVVRQMRMVQGR